MSTKLHPKYECNRLVIVYLFIIDLFFDFTDKMNYLSRIENMLSMEIYRYLANDLIQLQNNVFHRHYGRSFPCVWQLAKQTSLVIVNIDQMLVFPQPISRKVIYVGGLGIDKPNQLRLPPVNIMLLITK